LVPSTSTTVEESPSVSAPVVGQVEPGFLNWAYEVNDVAVSPDGLVYVTAPVGVATHPYPFGEGTLIDVEGLPAGTGLNDELFPVRHINQIATGPDGLIWIAGFAMSHADDEQFGGTLDRGGRRILWWVARNDDCDQVSCSWTVFTTNEVPEFAYGLGVLVVSADGTLYASAGEDLLLVFDGTGWESHRLPAGWAQGSPWSGSLAVGGDGVVWAASIGRGLVAYDPVSGFTRYTTDDGLPSDNIAQVASAGDGMIWVATDALYPAPSAGSPDVAAGVASFDGTTWTTYTMADGLVWNDGVVAAGPNGTVWTVHNGTPPHGYARLDGTTWTSYLFGQLPVGGSRSAVGPDGTLWTVSEDGLISFDGITRTVHDSPFRPPGLVAGGYEIDEFVGGLGTPNDLAFDPTGGLYVSETEAQQVRRIEILPDGSAGESRVVASGIDDAEGLALTDDGVLYVSSDRLVYRVADGVTTPFADGFDDPEGLALDGNGNLYVADDTDGGTRISRVQVLADGTAGIISEVVIVPGGGAGDIDFGPSGELFVANGDAVWTVGFAADGTVELTRLDPFPGSPKALAFDPLGELHVGTSGSVWSIESGTALVNGLDSVEGLAFGPSGTLYMSNVGTNQILRLTPPTGTITISIDGWEGVEGYRLLAGVWDESFNLVGGAFWTIIDSDPYSATDITHPPFSGDDPPGVEYETWGEGDYLWDQTALLEPGNYQIDFWANPGELAPYGHALPSSPIERECSVDVEVRAGENTTVVISGIPATGFGSECR
jgi:sugar lactone lactonase YvrE